MRVSEREREKTSCGASFEARASLQEVCCMMRGVGGREKSEVNTAKQEG